MMTEIYTYLIVLTKLVTIFWCLHIARQRLHICLELFSLVIAVDLQEGAATPIKMRSCETILDALIRRASNDVAIGAAIITNYLEHKYYKHLDTTSAPPPKATFNNTIVHLESTLVHLKGTQFTSKTP